MASRQAQLPGRPASYPIGHLRNCGLGFNPDMVTPPGSATGGRHSQHQMMTHNHHAIRDSLLLAFTGYRACVSSPIKGDTR